MGVIKLNGLDGVVFKANRPKATQKQIDFILDLQDQASDYLTTKDCEYVDSLTKDISKLTLEDAKKLISFLQDRLPDPYDDWGSYEQTESDWFWK